VKQARAGHEGHARRDIDHDFAERTTFIVTPDGKVACPARHVATANVEKALEACRRSEWACRGR
jgi:hypothetical protein